MVLTRSKYLTETENMENNTEQQQQNITNKLRKKKQK